MENIEHIEARLWEAADQLRANSKLTSTEYSVPVLGLIFLRYAYNRFLAVKDEIEATLPTRNGVKRKLSKEDFVRKGAMFLREKSHYDMLLNLPEDKDKAKAIIAAMEAIEEDYPTLAGVLPKEYQIFDNETLSRLLKNFNGALTSVKGDVFGRIYEYFLMKFAMQGAQDSGEFFTPVSLVQTIVNIIEPDHGTVFDPACGSGGMFVQTSHFLEGKGKDPHALVTFRGQEKTALTIRLARMNLAVHGLEGKIEEGNTFYDDRHNMLGKADFVMANPPFNVDEVDADKIKGDPRLPFGLPGVNQKNAVSNGNYLWISYFYSYLNEKGRAGFVMSSQASSAGNKEAEVRRKLVETGHVDVMVSIRSNFFYTRTVPCELWHLDKGKPENRRNKVLMLDARNIYCKVTRKIYDFSPEQLKNLTAIAWLYRGQTERFIGLMQEYLERTIVEANAMKEKSAVFWKSYEAYAGAAVTFLKTVPKDSALFDAVKERDEAAKESFALLDKWTARIAKDWKKPCEAKLAQQKKYIQELDDLANACRDLVKGIDLVGKLGVRVMDIGGKEAGGRSHASWDSRAIAKLEKELDASRKELVEQLKAVIYFQRQAHWLISRFPEAKFTAVPGLCKVVSIADIKAADWSLTPGRYVGVAPQEVDEDFDFEQSLRDINVELADLNQEAAVLAEKIQKKFEELNVR